MRLRVQEKRQGGKTLRISLGAPIAVLPDGLARLGARLEEDGKAIDVDAPPGGSFGPVLAAVATAGLPVGDVETRRARLEDVFVSILGSEGGAAP